MERGTTCLLSARAFIKGILLGPPGHEESRISPQKFPPRAFSIFEFAHYSKVLRSQPRHKLIRDDGVRPIVYINNTLHILHNSWWEGHPRGEKYPSGKEKLTLDGRVIAF